MSRYFQAYTQVLDGLPLSTTSAGELARHVCRYFQAYTQVQIYLSWPGQPVATAPPPKDSGPHLRSAASELVERDLLVGGHSLQPYVSSGPTAWAHGLHI